ncbi:MAG: N-acetylmuramoyl-L-alanine amidase [Myxococcota bacterium]|nr:N-acetylmuramoyl-L-alanine amidase [Myxococcota bacterium]
MESTRTGIASAAWIACVGMLGAMASGCAADASSDGDVPWEDGLLGADAHDEKDAAELAGDLGTTSAALTSASGVIAWTSGQGLVVRSGPGTSHARVTWLAEGTRLRITCQTSGTSVGGNAIWDYVPDRGGYVADYFMNTGYASWITGLPRCGAESGGTGSASGIVSWTDGDGVTLRSGPGTHFSSAGWLAEGTRASISCQQSGTTVGGNSVWDYLPAHRGYVADVYMRTGSSSWISGVPRCAAPTDDGGGSASTYDGPDHFIAARASHIESRGGSRITHIIIHTMEGGYRGSIGWFQDPANTRRTSAHFLIRSSDGEITQMVRESDAARHIGSWNAFTIGIEHEGFMSNPAWFTDAMYRSSARLVRHLCDEYGIPIDREHILGHGEVPGALTNDPGPHWDWPRYIALVRTGGR